MRPIRTIRHVVISLCLAGLPVAGQADDAVLAFTDYPGWRLLRQIEKTGLDLREMQSQAEATEAFRSGAADLVAITQVDLLALLAEGDAAPDAVILFPASISAGADVVVGRAGPNATDLSGRRIGLARESVSHYLLVRELDTFAHVDDLAPVIVDIAAGDVAAALLSGRIEVAALRAPGHADLIDRPELAVIFDSRAIGSGIVDLIVMRRDRYMDDPDIAVRLTDAWFRALSRIEDPTAEGVSRHRIATAEGAKRMMSTGAFMFSVLRALDFVKVQHRDLRGTTSLNPFAIRFEDGTVLGDPENVKVEVRFDHFRPPLP